MTSLMVHVIERAKRAHSLIMLIDVRTNVKYLKYRNRKSIPKKDTAHVLSIEFERKRWRS